MQKEQTDFTTFQLSNSPSFRIAIVHDDLMQWGGAERLVVALTEIFPDAPLFTSMADDAVVQRSGIDRSRVITSFLDRLPLKSKLNRILFSLYPIAFESFNFESFSVVISTSTRFAHGIITKPDTTHIAYVNSPFRGFWDPSAYFGSSLKGRLLQYILKPELLRLRGWDYIAGQRADVMFGNSNEIVKRIRKYYRRETEAFFPFVDFDRFDAQAEKPTFNLPDEYFIVMGRLIEWKRFDLVIEACNRLKKNLIVVGTGAYEDQLKKIAGPTVTFTGFASDNDANYLLKHATALIHPQLEDFGMTIVEANYCKVPVIAYGAGGALDTVVAGETGELFYEQSVDSLTATLEHFNRSLYSTSDLYNNAERFSRKRFEDHWKKLVESFR